MVHSSLLRSSKSFWKKLQPDRPWIFLRSLVLRSVSFGGTQVLRYTNPSNFRGSLLEGNKDHLLNRARWDLVKQEFHVEFLDECIGEFQLKTEVQRLTLQGAQYGIVESRREQCRLQENCLRGKMLFETLKFEVYTWNYGSSGKEHRIYEESLQVLRENFETSVTVNFPIAANANTNDLCDLFFIILRCGIKLQWLIVTRLQSACDEVEFSFHAQATSDWRLIHEINLKETVK